MVNNYSACFEHQSMQETLFEPVISGLFYQGRYKVEWSPPEQAT